MSSDLTVEEYFLIWLGSIHVAEGTALLYEHNIKTKLTPKLGDLPIEDLTADHVRSLYTEMEAAGLASKTIFNFHGLLHKALRDAVERRIIPFNVVDTIHLKKPHSRVGKVWTAEQVKTFLTRAGDDSLFPLWRLLATTGMRRGEALGLFWKDLDGPYLTIERTYTPRKVFKPSPKTKAGFRTISLDQETIDTLYRHKNSEHYVIAPHDRPVHPEYASKRFPRLAVKHGLPRIRLHDLRHTYATLALQQCQNFADMKTLSRRLGHASITFTLDTYGHVLRGQDEELANQVAGMF